MNDQNTNSFNLHNRKTRNKRHCFQKALKRKWKWQTLLNTSLTNQPTRAHNILGPPHWFSLVGNLVIVLEEVRFSTLILPTGTISEMTEITSSECSGNFTPLYKAKLKWQLYSPILLGILWLVFIRPFLQFQPITACIYQFHMCCLIIWHRQETVIKHPTQTKAHHTHTQNTSDTPFLIGRLYFTGLLHVK